MAATPRSETLTQGENPVEVLLLGAAQDGGFPQVGCYCPNCSLVYDGSLSSDTAVSLAVIDHVDKKWYLVEATPHLAQQWAQFAGKLCGYALSGVFLTHAHVGHYPGLLFFGKECMNSFELPIYASFEMHQFLEANEPWGTLYRNSNVRRVDISEHTPIRLSDRLTFRCKFVIHRRDFTDTCSFFISGPSKTLFFCPDIDGWDGLQPTMPDIVRECDVSLLDATFYDNLELPGRDMSTIPHPRVVDTISRLQECIGALDLHNAVLIHLNHSNRLWSEPLESTKGLYVGTKGMSWCL